LRRTSQIVTAITEEGLKSIFDQKANQLRKGREQKQGGADGDFRASVAPEFTLGTLGVA
jgi:hypothetical protein